MDQPENATAIQDSHAPSEESQNLLRLLDHTTFGRYRILR
jgi:hypothetical protein